MDVGHPWLHLPSPRLRGPCHPVGPCPKRCEWVLLVLRPAPLQPDLCLQGITQESLWVPRGRFGVSVPSPVPVPIPHGSIPRSAILIAGKDGTGCSVAAFWDSSKRLAGMFLSAQPDSMSAAWGGGWGVFLVVFWSLVSS